MPQKRLTMRQIREILRLKWDKGLSQRVIAHSCRISASTVNEYLKRAEKGGLRWPLPEEMTEEGLAQLLYPEEQKATTSDKVVPDWEQVRKELKRKNVTLRLLWTEYKEKHAQGYQYSQFTELYRRWQKKQKPVKRNEHKAGDKMFVDYTGQKVAVYDAETGEVNDAEIFVAVLGASNYTYAEAQWGQDSANWINGHTRACNFFGGVPNAIVPDNLKSGVTAANYYDPKINLAYQEWAEHYGVVILPARAAKPRDKAKVEGAVLIVERWILARLRDRKFFSLAALNKAIADLLKELNDRPMQQYEQSRRCLFEEIEQADLNPLPEKPYEFTIRKIASVHIDYHVEYKKHCYSVPHTLIHEEVSLRVTEHLVEIFHKSQKDPVATHPLSYAPGRFTTLAEHMPPNHRLNVDWTPERFLRWADEIGPSTQHCIEYLLKTRSHPEQAFRSCLGILKLANKYSKSSLEIACGQIGAGDAISYREIKSRLEAVPPPTQPVEPCLPPHVNMRGEQYYN
jgi:transposase